MNRGWQLDLINTLLLVVYFLIFRAESFCLRLKGCQLKRSGFLPTARIKFWVHGILGKIEENLKSCVQNNVIIIHFLLQIYITKLIILSF